MIVRHGTRDNGGRCAAEFASLFAFTPQSFPHAPRPSARKSVPFGVLVSSKLGHNFSRVAPAGKKRALLHPFDEKNVLITHLHVLLPRSTFGMAFATVSACQRALTCLPVGFMKPVHPPPPVYLSHAEPLDPGRDQLPP